MSEETERVVNKDREGVNIDTQRKTKSEFWDWGGGMTETER